MKVLDEARLQLLEIIMRLDDVSHLNYLRREAEMLTNEPQREAQLLYKLLHEVRLPDASRIQFIALNELQHERPLTPPEQQQLRALIDEEEKLRVQRVELLVELAKLRKTTPLALAQHLQLERIGDAA